MAEHHEGIQELSDSALVLAVARWRQDALAEVYRRHGDAAYGLAHRVLKDATMAEDVVQEVFLRLWARPEDFDPEQGRLRSFLLALAHKRAVDAVRADTERRARAGQTALPRPEGGPDVEREVGDKAVAGEVRQAILGLPDNQRQAIELTYFGGWTCREVAASLGVPEATVTSTLRVGLRRMREQMAKARVEP